MNDLKQRLLPMEQLAVPDQWAEIERRQPRFQPSRQPSGWRRIVLVAGVLAIGAGVVAIALIALSGLDERPSGPSTVGALHRNGIIAYASIDQRGMFWTIHPDGSGRTKVPVDVPGYIGVPSWSPDGTRIVFAVTSFAGPHPEGGNYDIYVTHADGSDPVRLTNDGVSHDPVWSPDGRSIAYVGGNPSHAQQIWTMSTDGSGAHQLTNGKGLATFPSWSPDGSQIAFASFEGSNADIYVIRADGSDVRRLTEDPAHEDRPVWSPDGQRIAFTSQGTRDPGVYAMSSDGTGVTELLHDPGPANLGLAWAPDGTKIAIVSLRGEGNTRNVYLLNVNNGDLSAIGQPGAYFGPSWQPLPLSDSSTVAARPPGARRILGVEG